MPFWRSTAARWASGTRFPRAGTSAVTRVLIDSADHDDTWGTIGVSENLIEASWQALVDSLEHGARRAARARARTA